MSHSYLDVRKPVASSHLVRGADGPPGEIDIRGVRRAASDWAKRHPAPKRLTRRQRGLK